MVLRINDAPAFYEACSQHVGKRTSVRVLSASSLRMYHEAFSKLEKAVVMHSVNVSESDKAEINWKNEFQMHWRPSLPLEENVTIILSPTDSNSREYAFLKEKLDKYRPDVTLRLLSPAISRTASELLASYTDQLLEHKVVENKKELRRPPSSGLLTIVAALQLCSSVTDYGIGVPHEAGVGYRYLGSEHRNERGKVNEMFCQSSSL